MKKITLLLITVAVLFAIQKEDVYRAYKEKDFKNACYLAAKIYLKKENRQDGSFLTVFADSCLKADNINRMAFPAMLLYRTSGDRSNSIYFLTVLYQKKMLYKALIDGFDVKQYNFPSTTYILSKIFVKYRKGDFKKRDDIYIFKNDKDPDKTYHLYIKKENGIDKMVLETYDKKNLIKTRVYW